MHKFYFIVSYLRQSYRIYVIVLFNLCIVLFNLSNGPCIYIKIVTEINILT